MITNSSGYPLGDTDYDDDKGDYPVLYNLYPDDEKFFAELIRNEWELTGPAQEDRVPMIVYDSNKNATRDSRAGSIFIYGSSATTMQVNSLGYESERQSKNMTIDVQTMDRDRGFAWVREIRRILAKYRRPGRRTLGGWDYLTLRSITNRSNSYIGGFMQFVIEISLERYIKDLPEIERDEQL